MDEEMFPKDKRPDETAEGVRIIDAEEAEKAIEREDVARRLPHDAPGSCEFAAPAPCPDPEPMPSTRAISSDPRRVRQRTRPTIDPGRDVQQAFAVGVGIAVLFLVLAKAGPKYVMAIVVAVIVLASI